MCFCYLFCSSIIFCFDVNSSSLDRALLLLEEDNSFSALKLGSAALLPVCAFVDFWPVVAAFPFAAGVRSGGGVSGT